MMLARLGGWKFVKRYSSLLCYLVFCLIRFDHPKVTFNQVRSHAKALGCNMVVGYEENTVICEDVLIMSSSGTAAVCNLEFMSELEVGGGGGGGRSSFSKELVLNCGICHIPYSEASVPFPIKLVRCGLCGKGKV